MYNYIQQNCYTTYNINIFQNALFLLQNRREIIYVMKWGGMFEIVLTRLSNGNFISISEGKHHVIFSMSDIQCISKLFWVIQNTWIHKNVFKWRFILTCKLIQCTVSNTRPLDIRILWINSKSQMVGLHVNVKTTEQMFGQYEAKHIWNEGRKWIFKNHFFFCRSSEEYLLWLPSSLSLCCLSHLHELMVRYKLFLSNSLSFCDAYIKGKKYFVAVTHRNRNRIRDIF